MSTVSLGDLARSFQLRQENSRLNTELQRLTKELSTGRKSEIGVGTARDLGPIAGLERSLSTLAAYKTATQEAGLAAETGNAILGRISTDTESLSGTLLQITSTASPTHVAAAAASARDAFASAVSSLNSSVSGRSLFAGRAFDGPALAGAEDMLADLYAAASGAATAADAQTAIDTWFDTGGGFETMGYVGSADAADPVAVADGVKASPLVQANDPAIVETLKQMATAALLDLGLLDGAPDERATLAVAAGEGLLASNTDLTNVRATVGAAQERIAVAATRNEAETSAFEIARNELVSADPYDTANRLQAAERQLQMLYTLTGRLSNLSLTSYLR